MRHFGKTVTARLLLASALTALTMILPSQALACEAEALVKGIATSFERAAKNQSPRAFAISAARYTNMRTLALFALGPYRAQLPQEDEARYVSLARSFLGRWMAENSTRISGSGLTIQTCSAQLVSAHFGNGTSVQFKLAGPRRVSDISISGISLAGVLRNKFTEVLRSHNGDTNALMDYLAR